MTLKIMNERDSSNYRTHFKQKTRVVVIKRIDKQIVRKSQKGSPKEENRRQAKPNNRNLQKLSKPIKFIQKSQFRKSQKKQLGILLKRKLQNLMLKSKVISGKTISHSHLVSVLTSLMSLTRTLVNTKPRT